MHRLDSLLEAAQAVAQVPASGRHAAGLILVAGALDRAADPRLDDAGPILLDERNAPGCRRAEAPRLRQWRDRIDREAHERRVEGDYAGYVQGFQAARAVSALVFLIADGGVALPDIAYEAVMVCGAAEPVVAEIVGGRR